MYIFDASSVIHAWDNYPIDNFPPLWNWLEEQITSGTFSISQVAYTEVSQKSPDCGRWLKDKSIIIHAFSNEVLQEATVIKQLLGITEDAYNSKGVCENDLIIIATAKVHGLQLISDEGRQHNLPKIKSRYKIPAVCDIPNVNVVCIQFIELIKTSGAIFH